MVYLILVINKSLLKSFATVTSIILFIFFMNYESSFAFSDLVLVSDFQSASPIQLPPLSGEEKGLRSFEMFFDKEGNYIERFIELNQIECDPRLMTYGFCSKSLYDEFGRNSLEFSMDLNGKLVSLVFCNS